METRITIPCESIRLDGWLNLNPGSKKGVVVTHPHPLYGGNMDNSVVLQIVQSFYRAGFTTLRFNFRGTGESSGMFDNGDGEQDDVRAALACLGEEGISEPYLAGYSFGSWVNARVVDAGAGIKDHIMVSPPCAFLAFDDVEKLPDTGLIVTGGNDDIAPPDKVRALIERWESPAEFAVLKNGDHFYSQTLAMLDKVLAGYLA
ncbi:MAG: alpha/beta hydrolase [Desulfobacter sp.]|nr:MAG: alpha/beta hydrolase [Desulfobacter sp.]